MVRKTFDTLKREREIGRKREGGREREREREREGEREREIVHLEQFGLIGEYEHFYTLDLQTLLLAL